MAARPRYVWKGTRRALLTKVKRAIAQLEAQDTREALKATEHERTPRLFFDATRIRVAAQRLTDQLDEKLAEKS